MRKIIHKIALGVNILFALALLISYLAVHISPEDFALPALFGLAYPYLLLLNFLIAILWAVNLRKEAIISVIVITAGLTHFSNYIKFRKIRSDREGTFRVVSYNLRLFSSIENERSNNTEKQILELLRTDIPQVVCFQELYINGDNVSKDQEIKTGLGGSYNSHIKLITNGRNRYYGIATYSKYPIAGRGEIIHPGSSSLSIFTDVIIQNDTFRIYNNHLQSFRLKAMERSFVEELIEIDDRQKLSEIRSLSSNLRRGFIRRAIQADTLKEHINKSPYPVIVAGDFNDTPVSYSYRKIRKGLNDAFVSSGYGAGFTYRGFYPPNRIDYILYDNSLKSASFEILKVRYSDHYPIFAYFRKSD